MKTIHKYTLRPEGRKIVLPKGAKILSAHVQHGGVCIWVEVELGAEEEEVTIAVYGTGQAIPDIAQEFIGTVLVADDSFVFHIYKVL